MDLGGLKPAASGGAKATTLYKAHVVYNDFAGCTAIFCEIIVFSHALMDRSLCQRMRTPQPPLKWMSFLTQFQLT